MAGTNFKTTCMKIENRKKACDLAIEYDSIESFMEFVSSLRAEDYIELIRRGSDGKIQSYLIRDRELIEMIINGELANLNRRKSIIKKQLERL
ncbi:hypothetical protein K260102G11_19160 [Bacteroides uniformis]